MGIGQKIKELREAAHLTQQELAKMISISRSTLAGYESENKQPSYQVLSQIAGVFKVPTDYILGVGIFKNWDVLLENKNFVIEQISMVTSRLSSDILNGLDNMTFARLAYAFDVQVLEHKDGSVGITLHDPIPTYPTTTSVISDGERLKSIFNSLSQDDQIILLGKALDLKRSSVAADEPEGRKDFNMGFFDFLAKLCKKTPNNESEPKEFCISIESNNSVSSVAKLTPQDKTYDIDSHTKYVMLSTSGDGMTCPMCAQFERKYFAANNAPKLPLCPSCGCCYEHYYKEDLPSNAIISKKDDFVLPADCTPMFYNVQHKVFEEKDIEKRIRLCRRQLKALSEFMHPYLSAGFPSPDDLACRDLLPDLYMQLGKWESAKNVIQICIDEKAYYPSDGSDAMANFEQYKKVARETLAYISNKPGCLQSSIYKAMKYEGEEKELLKDFLRYSRLIRKEKHTSTYELYCSENDL